MPTPAGLTEHVAESTLRLQLLLGALVVRVAGDAHIIVLGQHDVRQIEIPKGEALGLPLEQVLLICEEHSATGATRPSLPSLRGCDAACRGCWCQSAVAASVWRPRRREQRLVRVAPPSSEQQAVAGGQVRRSCANHGKPGRDGALKPGSNRAPLPRRIEQTLSVLSLLLLQVLYVEEMAMPHAACRWKRRTHTCRPTC